MLSDSEQRRLAEIESSLAGDDPAFVHRFGSTPEANRLRRLRLIAAVVALCGVIGAVIGLAQLPVLVAVVVVSVCAVGVAGCIFTYRPPTVRRH